MLALVLTLSLLLVTRSTLHCILWAPLKKALERNLKLNLPDSDFRKASQQYQTTGLCATVWVPKSYRISGTCLWVMSTPTSSGGLHIQTEWHSLHRTQLEKCRHKPYTCFGVTDKCKCLGGSETKDNQKHWIPLIILLELSGDESHWVRTDLCSVCWQHFVLSLRHLDNLC